MTLGAGTVEGPAVPDGTSRAEAGSPGRRAPFGRAARAWPAAWGAAVGAALFLVAHRAMPDDALITLSFARNLAEHGQWALTTGIEAHTATSPLDVALLAGAYLASGGRAFVAVGLVLCGCLAVVGAVLYRRGGPVPAVLGPVLLASSPVLSSSVGLETFLSAAVLVALVDVALDGRLVLSGLLVAAAALTRPDLVVPACVVVALAAVHHRRVLAALPLGALVAAPWFAFAWWHLGSAWPHTVAVKMAAGAWPQGSITSVGYFLSTFPGATAVTVATLVAGGVATVAAFVRSMPAAGALGAAGAAHLGALALQDTPPIEYYLAPGVAGLGLALVLAVRRLWRVVPVVVVLGALVQGVAHGPLWGEGLAPMRQNYATNDEYAAIARELPRDGLVLSTVEIGALAFSCQDHGCRVVDRILADPVATDRYVARWRAEHPWAEPNYLHHRAPVPGEPPRWVLRRVPDVPAAGTWRITRAPGVHERVRLDPAP